MTLRRERFHPLFLFLGNALLLLLLHGNRLVFTNDEGILLEPAQRLASGARPYIDFFGYMSPGSYWWQALLFRCLGVSYWVGRLPVILDFSTQCALVFWLTRRLSSSRAAFLTAALFFCFQGADPSFLTAQHRWDSATLALGGTCALLAALDARQPRLALLGGLLLAASAWCTPMLALVLLTASAWLVFSRNRRSLLLIPFLTGAAVSTLAAVTILLSTGTLAACWNQMLWLRHNYSGVNVMPYGSVIGGYAPLFADAHGWELGLRAVLSACIALPAWLPLAALAGWSTSMLRGKLTQVELGTLLLLLPSTLALLAGTFPRADLMHLAFVAALPYALAGAWLARFAPAKLTAPFTGAALAVGLLFSMNLLTGSFSARRVSSPVGALRVAPAESENVRSLLAAVPLGASLYVHPYMPVHYFVTQASNPTRFSFLAPGMMTSEEEHQVLSELQAKPPEWVLYLHVSRDEFLRVFPNAGSLSEKFDNMERWLSSEYQPASPAITVGGYRLLHRKSATVAHAASVPDRLAIDRD